MIDKIKIIEWLHSSLSSYEQIVDYNIFGSFSTSNASAGDVDIVLIFAQWEQKEYMRHLKHSFFQEFRLKLHIQGFHREQKIEILSFLREAARRKDGKGLTLYDSHIP